MMKHFTAPDGTRLAYRDEGTGLPVLALAGLTRNGDDFDFLAPHLEDVRLIRLDLRGRGASDHADPETYTVPVESTDVLALLDHLGLEKIAILGTSRGGIVGMSIAGLAKPRLAGLCLNDVGPVIEAEGLKDIIKVVGLRPAQSSFAEAAEARATYMQTVGFSGVPKSRWEAEVRNLFVETKDGLDIRYDPRLREAVDAAAKFPLPDLWPFFDALADLPLALIRGQNSTLLSAETAAEMQRRRPDMSYAEVPGRGHVPFLDEPEALATIRSWLRQLR